MLVITPTWAKEVAVVIYKQQLSQHLYLSEVFRLDKNNKLLIQVLKGLMSIL